MFKKDYFKTTADGIIQTIGWIILIASLNFFSSCNEEKEITEPVSLSQTVWKGILGNGENNEMFNLQVVFYNDSVGQYYYVPIESNENIIHAPENTFFYRIEGKIILFNVIEDNLLAGYWWITNYNGKEIMLTEMPGNNNSQYISLKKIY